MNSSTKVIKKLIKKNISISVVESCSGGLISNTLVKHDGISKIFSLGLVCYSNYSKYKYLSVCWFNASLCRIFSSRNNWYWVNWLILFSAG